MGLLTYFAIAVAIFVAGAAGGIRWHAGQDALQAREAQALREADARTQRQLNDHAAGRHAGRLATLNHQLGDARAQIARLSGRTCLDAGTVGMLNATGLLEQRAAASEPARPASAPATPAGDRDATDADVAGYVALCRTRYAEVMNQLNEILDREDRLHPPLPVVPN